MEKYRVRKGIMGSCVLQVLEKHPEIKIHRWVDVKYSEAPRALVSEFEVFEEIKRLEIDLAMEVCKE